MGGVSASQNPALTRAAGGLLGLFEKAPSQAETCKWLSRGPSLETSAGCGVLPFSFEVRRGGGGGGWKGVESFSIIIAYPGWFPGTLGYPGRSIPVRENTPCRKGNWPAEGAKPTTVTLKKPGN